MSQVTSIQKGTHIDFKVQIFVTIPLHSSAPSTPKANQAPHLQEYLVWGGDSNEYIGNEFSEYRGKSLDEVLSTFKGVIIDGVMHEFM